VVPLAEPLEKQVVEPSRRVQRDPVARAVDLPLRLPTVMMSIVQPAGEESGPIPRARATTSPVGRSRLCFTITLLLADDCPGMLARSGTCRKQHRDAG